MEQPGEVKKVLMGSLIPGNGARIFTFFIKRALHLSRVLILRTTAFFRSNIGGGEGRIETSAGVCVCVCGECVVWERIGNVAIETRCMAKGQIYSSDYSN